MAQATTNIINDVEIITKVKSKLIAYRTDIAERNDYIERRDGFLYGTSLNDSADIPDGFDNTEYNWLRRTVDIQKSQLMGEMPTICSYYYKDDTSIYTPDQQDQIKITNAANQERQVRADGRSKAIDAILRDNGGERLFADGAAVGSAYGSTLYQMYWDDQQKKIVITLLESIQNWYPIWSDNNFREREGDAYVMQMGEDQAYRLYADKLTNGEVFPVTYAGEPFVNISGNNNSSIGQQGETVSSGNTKQPMVTKINYTGYLPMVAYDKKGNFVEVERGKETKLSFTSVGNTIVAKITKEDSMPRIYYIPNKTVMRRPYGESDIVESLIQINITMMEMASAEITLANKINFPLIQAIGFDLTSIPPRNQREISVIPMSEGQQLVPVPLSAAGEIDYSRIMAQLQDQFIRLSGIGRVLWDDPTVNTASGSALLTSMRGIIDVVRGKQQIWGPELCRMFEDALRLAATKDKDVKALVDDTEDWYLYIEWPSSMMREDPQHQVMLLNDLHAGAISIDTYMSKRGIRDVTEEIAKITSAMKDVTRAAIMGGKLPELAQFTIYESMNIPPYGFNPPKVQLRGTITPQQEGNLAQGMGWNDGPFGASIGPQGAEGQAADNNYIDAGQIQGNPYDGGTPTDTPPGGLQPQSPAAGAPSTAPQPGQPSQSTPGQMQGQPGAPMLTAGQNQPGAQPMSQPGSGAVSTPTGAVTQRHQRKGR